MKATLSTGKFLDAIALASRCVSKRTSLPVLSCLLVEAKADKLFISAHDLDRCITVSVPATVKEVGAFVCSASRLALAVSRHSISVELKATDKSVAVVSDGEMEKKAVLMILSAEEFPKLFENGNGSTVSTNELKPLLKRAIPSASIDTSRFILNSVRLETNGKELDVVATSGKTLVHSTLELDNWVEQNGTIPTNVANDLFYLMPDEGTVDFCVGEKFVSIKTERFIYVAKLIDGDYPNWKQVIPVNEKKFKMEREILIRAIEGVAELDEVTRESTGGRVEWKSDGKTIHISSQVNGDNIEVTLPVRCAPHEMAFNGNTLVKHLKTWDCDEVTMIVGEAKTPFIVRCAETMAVFTVLGPRA